LCRREIISLGLEESVHLLGYRTDLHDLLQASDVFLSTSSWEGLPLTVLEAFAAGVPCVLSSIEEHREMSLGVEGAYLADADSPHSVAQQVLECARENWSKTQLVLSRREGLSRYSIDHCANQYLDLYESIIARREKQLSA
jgi:glycosyltransferase involved in cell wall biosynthesis